MSKVSDIYSKCYDKYFYLGLFLGLLTILGITIYTTNFISGILFACIPIACLILFYFFKFPHSLLITLFIVNYIIMGVSRYVSSISGGIVMDALLLLILFILFVRTVFFSVDYWKRFNNPLTYLSLIWLIYCIMEILNPYTTIELWMTLPSFDIKIKVAYPANNMAKTVLVPDISMPYPAKIATIMKKTFNFLLLIYNALIENTTIDKAMLHPKLAASVKNEKYRMPE